MDFSTGIQGTAHFVAHHFFFDCNSFQIWNLEMSFGFFLQQKISFNLNQIKIG